MRYSPRITLVLSLAVSSLMLFPIRAEADAGDQGYVETFSTTTYKDIANSSLNWDTGAGEINLSPFSMSITGAAPTVGSAQTVFVDGTSAFVADKANGLQIFDIADPGAPVLLGGVGSVGDVADVYVDGDLAYVTGTGYSVAIIDIEDLTAPVLLSSVDSPYVGNSLVVAGNRAYVSYSIGYITAVDVTDPLNPVSLSQFALSGDASDITVSGDLLFVGSRTSGLRIVDYSVPSIPVLIGTYNSPGQLRSAVVSGGLAYLADGTFGFRIVDVSDPTTPVSVGSVPVPGLARAIALEGTFAWIAAGSGGVTKVDVSDPALPVVVETILVGSDIWDIEVRGEHAFAIDNPTGLVALRVTNQCLPALVGSGSAPGASDYVVIEGTVAYLSNGSGQSLNAFDVSNPTVPSWLGSLTTVDAINEMAVSGPLLYVANADSGLTIVDASDPTAPSILSRLVTPGPARSIALAGGHAYLACGPAGITIVDITDPALPALLATVNPAPGSPDIGSVRVQGNRMFCRDSINIYGFNIEDPVSPVWHSTKGTVFSNSSTPAIIPDGNRAYGIGGYQQVYVMDITLPGDPTYFDTLGAASDFGDCCNPELFTSLSVEGDWAFVVGSNIGLFPFDVSNPSQLPYGAGQPHLNIGGSARAIEVDGEYAFIADSTSGIKVAQVFQSEFNTRDNVATSTPVDSANETILWARIATTQMDSVAWELSADAGANWQAFAPDAPWSAFAVRGNDLLWRSTHEWDAPGQNPTVATLTIDWLIQPALIESIVDVPGDQGGWAYLYFTRSGLDFPDETVSPILAYNIYRKIEAAALISELKSSGTLVEEDRSLLREDGRTLNIYRPQDRSSNVYTLDDNYYLVTESSSQAAPPGTWAVVSTVFAQNLDSYIALVPTVSDSSQTFTPSSYYIAAHTAVPAEHFDSTVATGYSLDNLAPAAPTGFVVSYSPQVDLSWSPSDDADFRYFKIYRGSTADFTIDPEAPLNTTINTSWVDTSGSFGAYYKISAVDFVGNESNASAPETVTAADSAPGYRNALYQNSPNPFNPETTIRFSLAEPARVSLRIYSLSGRLIKSIVGEQMLASGLHKRTWDGTDVHGRTVSSGIYLYKLASADFQRSGRMTLVK